MTFNLDSSTTQRMLHRASQRFASRSRQSIPRTHHGRSHTPNPRSLVFGKEVILYRHDLRETQSHTRCFSCCNLLVYYTIMKLSSSLLFWLSLLHVVTTTNAQLQCTFSAQDEDGCLSQTDDSGADHCVWCALSSFGFCVNEQQAESMEQNIPGVHCDRFTPAVDDDAVTPTDDAIEPNDDAIPDNFWTCLQDKDAASCQTDGCTWCNTKAGFGLCMTGPTAESAAASDWFDCEGNSTTATTTTTTTTTVRQDDVTDPSCLIAYLQDASPEACVDATDETGQACEWCNFAGQVDVCLTAAQADMGASVGVSCDSSSAVVVADDPYDTSCALAYLQDQTKDTCLAAKDEDGESCEYCTLQDSLNICLTQEQAEVGQQIGFECEQQEKETPQDPLDTSCELAYLEDPTEASCKAAKDQDGRACEWCDLQGSTNLCLNEDQAQMAQAIGVTCDAVAATQKLRGMAAE